MQSEVEVGMLLYISVGIILVCSSFSAILSYLTASTLATTTACLVCYES